jgi:hypothetical protein
LWICRNKKLSLLIKYLFSLLLKTFVDNRPKIIDNIINVREPSKFFLKYCFFLKSYK